MLDQTEAQRVILVGLVGNERLPEVNFLDLLRSMWLRRVRVEVVPAANTSVAGELVISWDVGFPLPRVGYPHPNNTQWAIKRTMDVAGSLIGFVVISPLLLGVAALIKLSSPGPILFRQKRVGADGKVFTCYKLRSMYLDAERRRAELEARFGQGPIFKKIRDDPRVTPLGRFLRCSSIDELPQLLNVLKGEMSLVGPRPLPLWDSERISELDR
jgi:lipopolysaccharide/colanic/teichoic acid biosynthesis glycosyltransferase